MSLETNRRSFILNSLKTAGGLAAFSTSLSSCTTLDEYLFEDSFFLKDQTVIIGAGLGGLHLAYKLKENKQSFRIFESSPRCGGRILSLKSHDYGASLFAEEDENLKKLIKSLGLTSAGLDRGNYFMPAGMQSLTDTLFQHTAGLITYRSIRLRWKLVSIQKINNYYEISFESPNGRRTFVTKKIAIAIPPSQWSQVTGLAELPEMKSIFPWAAGLRKENVFKVIVNSQQSLNLPSGAKPLAFFEDDNFSARQVVKKVKSNTWVELDLKQKDPAARFEIEKVNDYLKKKLSIEFSSKNMTNENYLDWSQIQFIQGSAFTHTAPMPELKSNHFQIVGDYASHLRTGTLEGALISSSRSAEFLL